MNELPIPTMPLATLLELPRARVIEALARMVHRLRFSVMRV